MAKTSAEFLKWFGPLLDALRDLGDSGRPTEVSNRIAQNLDLSEETLDETLKSGGKKFHNQVAWARQYLVWEGYLDSSKHGTWKLTQKGKDAHLTVDDAKAIFKKWVAIHQKARKEKAEEQDKLDHQDDLDADSAEEPDETDLISVLRNLSPSGFEKVYRELLRESGFENVEVTGRPADGGIDGYGTLEVNPFVSFKVLFHASAMRRVVPYPVRRSVISVMPCLDAPRRGSSLLQVRLVTRLFRKQAVMEHLLSS